MDAWLRFWADVETSWSSGARFLLDAAIMGTMVLAMCVGALAPIRLAHRGVAPRWIWCLLVVLCLYVAVGTAVYVVRGVAVYQYVPSSAPGYVKKLVQYTLMPAVAIPAMTILTRMGIAGMRSGLLLRGLGREIAAIGRAVERLKSDRPGRG